MRTFVPDVLWGVRNLAEQVYRNGRGGQGPWSLPELILFEISFYEVSCLPENSSLSERIPAPQDVGTQVLLCVRVCEINKEIREQLQILEGKIYLTNGFCLRFFNRRLPE